MIGEESGTTSTTPAHCRMHLQLAEGREHFEHAGNDRLLHRRVAALGIGRDAVEPAADHDLALVGLADSRCRCRDRARPCRGTASPAPTPSPAAHRSGSAARNPALAASTLEWPATARPIRVGADRAVRRLDADAAAALDDEAGHLAILDDVDAEPHRQRAHSPRRPHRGGRRRPCPARCRRRSDSARRSLLLSSGAFRSTPSGPSSSASMPLICMALTMRAAISISASECGDGHARRAATA